MNFKTATDALFLRVTSVSLAKRMGVSHARVRASRMNPERASYEDMREDWKPIIAKLARERAKHFTELAERLEP